MLSTPFCLFGLFFVLFGFDVCLFVLCVGLVFLCGFLLLFCGGVFFVLLFVSFSCVCFPTSCLVPALPQPVLNALFNAYFYRAAAGEDARGGVWVSAQEVLLGFRVWRRKFRFISSMLGRLSERDRVG